MANSVTTYNACAGMLAPATGSLGNIDAYIQAANHAPILTAERERELALRLRDHNDLTAAGELIVSHLRLVVSIARQYLGYGLPHADLIQEGNIGLMKAVKRFDPDRGVRLVSFAITWVRAEIQEYIVRNWRLVKVATTKAQRKLFFNLRSLRETTDALRPAEANRIAETLEVKPEEVYEMERRMMGTEMALDATTDDGDDYVSPSSWLTKESDEPEVMMQEAAHEKLLQSDLPEAVAKLDVRSRRIVQARWLYDESKGEKGATLADMAQELGVSQERVRQIEKKALLQLRSSLS